MADNIKILPMSDAHINGWRTLWYMNVGDGLNKPIIDHTQKQILDNNAPLLALLALSSDNEVIGLLHGVVHPVAGSLNPVCYMQDLFVHPARRRQGIAAALLDALKVMGEVQKWDRVYWLTDSKNNEAQALYKGRAIPLDFTFHILPIGMLDKLEDAQ